MSDISKDTKQGVIKEIFRRDLQLQMEDGGEGWVPYDEFAHSKAAREEIERTLHVGDSIEVVQCPLQQAGRTIPWYSIKRVTYDFWRDNPQALADRPLEMYVESVTPKSAYGVAYVPIEEPDFIEVEAFFSFADLDHYLDELTNDEHWRQFRYILPGDTVRGIAIRFDEAKELIQLDVAKYLRKFVDDLKNKQARSEKNPGANTVRYRPTSEQPGGAPGFAARTTAICRIVVVDNDEDFLNALTRLLNTDYSVKPYANVSDCESDLKRSESVFDVAIIDVNLEDQDDHKGLKLAERISRDWHGVKIILMTGESPSEGAKKRQEDELLIHDYLQKPFSQVDLLRSLSRVDGAEGKPLSHFLTSPDETWGGPAAGQVDTDPTPDDDWEDPEDSLKRLTSYCKNSTAILFAMHYATLSCSLMAAEGPMEMEPSLLGQLKFSPVRDCIVEKEFIHCQDAHDPSSYPKHKWLIRYCAGKTDRTSARRPRPGRSYRSCLGMQVPSNDVLRGRALFWVHPDPDMFDTKSAALFDAVTALINSEFRLRSLSKELVKERKHSLAGKTFRLFGHEISRLLHNLSWRSKQWLEVVRGANSESAVSVEDMTYFYEGIAKCGEIANRFLKYAGGDKDSKEADVVLGLRAARNTARDFTRTYDSYINILDDGHWPEGKALVKGDETDLEMVFFNLLLNACQQIDWFVRKEGEIHLRLDVIEKDQEKKAIITIEDTGPGIHGQDFKAIFHEGKTTRPDGTGLGLTLAERIVKKMGGTIQVKRSVLFVGSSFEIVLPVADRISQGRT